MKQHPIGLRIERILTLPPSRRARYCVPLRCVASRRLARNSVPDKLMRVAVLRCAFENLIRLTTVD